MRPNKNASLALKLSALAGAAGIAPVAHANIVQSTTLPLTPPSTANTTTFWDIDGSGHGFGLRNIYISITNRASLIFGSHASIVNNTQSFALANLPLHAVVGPSLANGNQFQGNINGLSSRLTSNGAAINPNFSKGTPGYFGFKFISGGINDYGWGTLLVTGTPKGQGFTIQNAYYDNTGASIKVGQTTSVPEPSSIALLALGATGLAAWRLRRKTATEATACTAA